MIKILLFLLTSSFSMSLMAYQNKTICGMKDNRRPSIDPRIGRAKAKKKEEKMAGCSVWMISDSCALTAGHCMPVLKNIEFHVPRSRGGITRRAIKENQYLVNQSSIEREYDGFGKDWAVLKLRPNKITDLYPGEVGGFFDLELKKLPRKGQKVRITGYGIATRPSYYGAQNTHFGIIDKVDRQENYLDYDVDTTGGNSGSPVVSEKTGKAIAIHTNGGCTNAGGANRGTLIATSPKLVKAIRACLASE